MHGNRALWRDARHRLETVDVLGVQTKELAAPVELLKKVVGRGCNELGALLRHQRASKRYDQMDGR